MKSQKKNVWVGRRILIGLAVCLFCFPAAGSAEVRFIGANVDIGQILPGAPNALKTDKGDLFDICAAVGINAFRVTSVGGWAEGEAGVPNTGADWRMIGERARATGISLIPVIEFTRKDDEDLGRVPAGPQHEKIWLAAAERTIDVTLGDSGLARTHQVLALDLGNELELNDQMNARLKTLSDYVHQKYPSIPVTEGGWRVALDKPNSWRWNMAPDGSSLKSFIDIAEPHIYYVPAKLGGVALAGSTPAGIVRAVMEYMSELRTWSGQKPIIVGEFGMPNGSMGVRDQVRNGAEISPAAQAAFYEAFLNGIKQVEAHGTTVTGVLAWILAPRGHAPNMPFRGNAFALVVPRGKGKPVELMPALFSLCPALRENCPATLDNFKKNPPIQQ